MKYYRYGVFRPGDYCMSWVGMVVLPFFSIASIVLDLSFLLVIFPTVYAMAWLWVILAPHREQFVICNDSITALFGNKTHTIILPSELTLVVSYADICPPLTKRTAVGKETHILKDKYAISILQKTPVDVAIEALHRNHVQTYTTSIIQTVFDDYRYIYSFVWNQSPFDKLIANRKCQLIIPESLVGRIPVDPSIMNVHIDMGC